MAQGPASCCWLHDTLCRCRRRFCCCVCCICCLQLYEVEGSDPTTSPVQRVQWLSYGTGPGQLLLQGHRILIVDEVS